jgi:hypothetical protein
MGRKKGSLNKVKKDKFSDLGDDFKNAISQSSTDEIRKRISDIAILECTTRAVLKEDPDVKGAKEVLQNLMQPYRDDLKAYKLQIEYAKRCLDDKGGGNSVQAAPNANALPEEA